MSLAPTRAAWQVAEPSLGLRPLCPLQPDSLESLLISWFRVVEDNFVLSAHKLWHSHSRGDGLLLKG